MPSKTAADHDHESSLSTLYPGVRGVNTTGSNHNLGMRSSKDAPITSMATSANGTLHGDDL